VKLHEIKSLKAIIGAIKKIRRIGAQLKFFNPKSKTLKDTLFRIKEENVSDMSFSHLAFVFYSFD